MLNHIAPVSLAAVLDAIPVSLKTVLLSVADVTDLNVALRSAVVSLPNVKLVYEHQHAPALKIPLLYESPVLVTSPNEVHPAESCHTTLLDWGPVIAIVSSWMIGLRIEFSLILFEFPPRSLRRVLLAFSSFGNNSSSFSLSFVHDSCSSEDIFEVFSMDTVHRPAEDSLIVELVTAPDHAPASGISDNPADSSLDAVPDPALGTVVVSSPSSDSAPSPDEDHPADSK